MCRGQKVSALMSRRQNKPTPKRRGAKTSLQKRQRKNVGAKMLQSPWLHIRNYFSIPLMSFYNQKLNLLLFFIYWYSRTCQTLFKNSSIVHLSSVESSGLFVSSNMAYINIKPDNLL